MTNIFNRLPYRSLQDMYDLIGNGADARFLARGLAAYNVPLALIWYFQGPIVTIEADLLHLLPNWMPQVIYTERLDLVLEEASLDRLGYLSTDADALAYLLSAALTERLLPKWTSSYGWLAEEILYNHNIQADCSLLLNRNDRPTTPHDCDNEPELLYQLRIDLRESIIRFARVQEITKRPFTCLPAPPLPDGIPTFQQLVGGHYFVPVTPIPIREAVT